MPARLEDTGERMVPEHHKGRNIYGAHVSRYEACLPFIKNKAVLDIACGSGYGTKLISEHADQVYGIDIDQETVDYAQEKFGAANITYKKGDGVAIPLENDAVDVVVSYETIEHIEDYHKFVLEVKRVLKTDGVFIVSTPNDEEYAEGNEFHHHEFTRRELTGLATKYFKHHDQYFQTLWLSSTILPPDLQTKEWDKPVRTIKTLALKPEQCVYFVAVCSDSQIKQKIEPVSTIGEHYRQRTVQEREKRHQANAARLKQEVGLLENQKAELEQTLDSMRASKAWKIGRFVTGLARPILRFVRPKKP